MSVIIGMAELWKVLNLNNRELALLAWSGVFAAIFFLVGWRQLGNLLKSFLQPAVSGIFLALIGYTGGVAYLLQRSGFWDISLFKDTVVWFFSAAVVTIFKSLRAAEQPHFFRRLFLETLTVSVGVSFVLSNLVMGLGWEIALVGIGTLLSMVQVIANSRKEHKSIRPLIQTLINVVASVVIVNAVFSLFTGFQSFATFGTLKQFLVAPTFTLLCLPFFVVFALFCVYQLLFIRLDSFTSDQPKLKRFAKWRALLETHGSLRRIQNLTGKFCLDIRDAGDRQSVQAVIHQYASAPDPVDLPGEVVEVRTLPSDFSRENIYARRILVNWKNLSERPASEAYADITAFDEDGEKLDASVADYCIFYAEDESEDVPPGGTFVRAEDEGYILISVLHNIDRVEAKITKLRARTELSAGR